MSLQIIKDYFKPDITIQKKLTSKSESLNQNNLILEKIRSKISESYKKNSIIEIMINKIKINHINILNKNIQKDIINIKTNLSILDRKKFKIIIIVLNTPLYEFLKKKERNSNEELIYLYTSAIKKKQYSLIPNVCDDVFYQLLSALLQIVIKLDISKIDVKTRIEKLDNRENILSTSISKSYTVMYN